MRVLDVYLNVSARTDLMVHSIRSQKSNFLIFQLARSSETPLKSMRQLEMKSNMVWHPYITLLIVPTVL